MLNALAPLVIGLDFDSQGNGLSFTWVEMLAQRTNQLSIGDGHTLDPDGCPNLIGAWLATSIFDHFLLNRVRDEHLTEQLWQQGQLANASQIDQR